jgi:DNA-binding SARP family transcriptional activator
LDRKRGGPDGRLGNLLRTLRRDAGLTQQGLAELSGVSVGMIRDLEQDRTARPSRWSLEQLSRALRLDDRTTRRLAAESAGPRCTAPAAGDISGPAPSWISGDGICIQVLGPLVLWRDAEPLALGGERQRTLLGVLALEPNGWLHRDAVVDALWGENPPSSAVNLVQTYTVRLQRLLCPPQTDRRASAVVSLSRHSNRYRLEVPTDRLDLLLCGSLVVDARNARAAGDVTVACDRYEQALQLWHGEPLYDIDALRGTVTVDGLRRRWATLVVEYAEACFAHGWYQRALPMVESLVRHDPLNEHAQACLMIALAATGQQAAAMAVYRQVCAELEEQLGIFPSRILTEAYESILHRRMAPSHPTRLFNILGNLRTA